ncbi:uncharacterized protein LOC119315555 [Triticum dicoccoides]|uniref:uncharacterized protein LOC119315555 n=1 Tax=Triticum dicoccoides TaxID=85692 RepID=UPI001891E4F3|nr:uncharacterized protein LOC119315555 [Triticum dicoccoides]
MAATLGGGYTSPAATPPLEDEDLLTEVLLRLPPQPSSLPRASLVSGRWRRLISDPRFVRRFRLRHRRNPPLVGFFDMGTRGLYFVPTLESPDRVPPGRFSLQLDDGDQAVPLGSRHGLVLFLYPSRKQVLVWDPVTAEQHCVALPPRFTGHVNMAAIHGAVLRAAGDVQHFQVVLLVVDNDDDIHHIRALACVYSSETRVWGDVFSAPLLPKVDLSSLYTRVYRPKAAVLVENSLYWMLVGNLVGILEFDLVKRSIAVISAPVDVFTEGKHEFTVLRTEGGGLGFLFLSKSNFSAQLWKRKTNSDGVASWELGRTIDLDKLIPLNSEERAHTFIVGFAEDNNVVFLWTVMGAFMIHLESMQLKKLPDLTVISCYHPFESVFAAGI